jgi:hypothetical protein
MKKAECIGGLEKAREENRPIVYCDEIVFSKSSIMKSAWSNRRNHFTTNQEDFYSGFRTVIAAVNSDMGLIVIDSEEVPTNEERFLAFIPKLVNAMGGEPFALYVDQLSVHKTKEVWKLYHKYDIRLILNVPASPEMNPIESCFSQVKRIYK